MTEIKQLNEFVDAVQEILGHCELTQVSSLKDPDVWRSTRKAGQNSYFVMKKDASYNYFRGLNYVRDYLKNCSVEVSEGYTSSSFFNFLEDQTRKNGNILTESKTWLDKLKTLQLKQFKSLIPISHYNFRNEIDLDTIRVVRLNDNILAQEFNVTPNNALQIHAQGFIDTNETDIYAIVNVESLEQEHAEELGYQVVEQFIYATKLIDPGSFARVRKKVMRQTAENILVMQDDITSDSFHNHNIPIRVIPNDEFYNNLQPYWDKLISFLYSKNRTELENVILSALYWFGEADIRIDSRIKLFLNFITGLEWITLHDYESWKGKANRFGKVCAKIFSGDEKYWEFWKDYYQKRNDINHQKLVEIYQEEIDTLSINLRSLLLQLIDHTDKYTNLKDLFDKEFGIN